MKWQHPTSSLKLKFSKTRLHTKYLEQCAGHIGVNYFWKPFTEHVGQKCKFNHPHLETAVLCRYFFCLGLSQEENELSTTWFQLEQFFPFVDPIRKKMKKWWRCGQSEKWDDEAMPGQPGPKDGRLDPSKDGRLGRMKESASNTFHSFSNHHYHPYSFSSNTHDSCLFLEFLP